MASNEKLTLRQAEAEMECFRKVFTQVRTLICDKIGGLQEISSKPENGDEYCPCYAFWGKEKACDNCISKIAFQEKCQKTKLEFLGNNIYQVTSRYVEIDGVPQVMELVKCLDDDSLVDGGNREKLINKLTSYDEKLYMDAMTGAFNRRYYEESVRKKQMNAGVAVIDTDDFKLCNDTFGHNAGDVALTTIVSIIRGCIRKTDILIRTGGDEFILILPDVGENFFRKKLEQIQAAVGEARVSQYERMMLSISIGGVMCRNEPVETAVERADRLMYQAKAEKNTVVTEKNALLGEAATESGYLDRNRKKLHILIIDDAEINREILTEMLKDDYQILKASSGEEGVALLEQYGKEINLVLLDIIMPGMDGFEVLKIMDQRQWIDVIPVIVISSENGDTFVRQAYELGAADYIRRPFDSKIVYQRVSNILKLYAKQRRLVALVTNQLFEREKNNRILTHVLGQVVEFRNSGDGLHTLRVSETTQRLLEILSRKSDRYPMTADQQYLIASAAVLHDIGLVQVDESILKHTESLTEQQFSEYKNHTIFGEKILAEFTEYQEEYLIQFAEQICRWHHEKYDGTGYPDGLKGEEIPIAVQVVSLAIAYDNLIRKAVDGQECTKAQAIQKIVSERSGDFQPLLLECLKEL